MIKNVTSSWTREHWEDLIILNINVSNSKALSCTEWIIQNTLIRSANSIRNFNQEIDHSDKKMNREILEINGIIDQIALKNNQKSNEIFTKIDLIL